MLARAPASTAQGLHHHFFFFFFFFFSFISLIADGPHHYHPACGHKGSSHLSPVHALRFFYRDASSALLQLVNQLNLTYSRTFPRFPLRKKEHKSYFGKNRTHVFRTSRCAAYLLDHSGDIMDLGISIFLIFVRCVALGNLELLIKTGWNVFVRFVAENAGRG